MHKHLRGILVLVVVSLASAGFAADSPEGALITDPAVLASMGFPPNATVYLAPGVGAGEPNPAPEPYGTASAIQVSHAGNDFQGRISTYAYGTAGGQRDVSFTGGDTFADAAVNLPSGAIWESTRFWVNDANAADIGLFVFRSCLPVAGPGSPAPTLLGSGSSTGTSGNQSIVVAVAPGTVIDNNGCIYWARARFDAAGLVLQKARSQYRLQVSAAPATATFPNDVPTTHPFFRFIEALAAAGITGGCGTGLYCPDQPVTRGQMAVFLSTALGLHFPN